MFRKWKLQFAIRSYKRQIAEIEQKRARSQASLVEAILTHTSPNDEDVDYFNLFTAEIDALREKMHAVESELAGLYGGKRAE